MGVLQKTLSNDGFLPVAIPLLEALMQASFCDLFNPSVFLMGSSCRYLCGFKYPMAFSGPFLCNHLYRCWYISSYRLSLMFSNYTVLNSGNLQLEIVHANIPLI